MPRPTWRTVLIALLAAMPAVALWVLLETWSGRALTAALVVLVAVVPVLLADLHVTPRTTWRGPFALLSLLILLVLGGYLPAVLTVKAINVEFKARAAGWLRDRLLWNEVGIPTTPDEFVAPDNPTLSPSKLGVAADDVPDPYLKPRVTRGEPYWQPNPKKTEEFINAVFAGKPLGIDEAVAPVMPYLTVSKEKSLREQLFASPELAALTEDEAVQRTVNKHFGNVYGGMVKNLRFQVIRWCNGWVQFATITAFWLAVVLLLRNLLVNVVLEKLVARYYDNERTLAKFVINRMQRKAGVGFVPFNGKPAETEHFSSDRVRTEGGILGRVFGRATDPQKGPAAMQEPFAADDHPFRDRLVIRMLRAVYEAFVMASIQPQGARERGSLYDVLDKTTQNRLKQLESKMASILYLAWALPSLGFIGTVLGIGDALLNAGDMLTPNTDLQKDAIQTITLSLGTAFDTTLVALLLSLVLMLMIYLFRMWEERVVLDFQSRIMDELISRLRA